MNEAQSAFLERHAYAGSLADMPPDLRLEFANLGDVAPKRLPAPVDASIIAPRRLEYVWDDDAGELVATKPEAAPMPPQDRPDLGKLGAASIDQRMDYANAVESLRAGRNISTDQLRMIKHFAKE